MSATTALAKILVVVSFILTRVSSAASSVVKDKVYFIEVDAAASSCRRRVDSLTVYENFPASAPAASIIPFSTTALSAAVSTATPLKVSAPFTCSDTGTAVASFLHSSVCAPVGPAIVHDPSAFVSVRHHWPALLQFEAVGGAVAAVGAVVAAVVVVAKPLDSASLLISTHGPTIVVHIPGAPLSVEQNPPANSQPASPDAWQSISQAAVDSKSPNSDFVHL